MTLDYVANRYGVLPSQVLREGNSLDVLIADTYQGYQTFLHNKSKGKASVGDQYTQDELLDILNKSKGK